MPKPHEVDNLFLRALEVEDSLRTDFVNEASAGDAALAAEVSVLLAAAAASSPLDRPLYESADRVLEAMVTAQLQLGSLSRATLGNYHLGALRGEGGMGEVYEAHRSDGAFERRVAVKVLRSEVRNSETQDRFHRERQLLAKLSHPNIVSVFDGGLTPDDRPYLVMPWISGLPLTDHCSHYDLELRDRVRLIITVCDTVQYAHEHGIVHRDLKPSNVLVERVDGEGDRVLLVDFGIAKPREGATLTRAGHTLGTPGYMSPEAALGVDSAANPESDVFSIGALLYELASGARLYSEPTEEGVRVRAREGAFRPPRHFEPSLDSELELIILAALERDPEDRYRSAAALGSDLRRWLEGKTPVLGSSGSFRSYLRAGRRHLLAIAIAVAGVLALLAVGAWFVESSRAATEQADVTRILGRQIERAESWIRTAHSRPFHDVGPEYLAAGRNLEGLVTELANSPDLTAFGDYVLGRRAWAVGDLQVAQRRFRAARQAGLREPDLPLRLGLVLAEIALEQDLAAVTEAPIEEEDPSTRAEAIALLTVGRSHAGAAELGSELYIDALIALLEGRFIEVDPLVKEARTIAPWLYQASALKAYARERRAADRFLTGDLGLATSQLELAMAAIEEALEIGRSDPAMHRARCRIARRMTAVAEASENPSAPLQKIAADSCQAAASVRSGTS